jgi:aspartate dehydrogenase
MRATTDRADGTGYGLIGFGRIGQRISARLAGRADAPRLVAVLVRPADAGAARAAAPDAHIFTDLDAFVEARPLVAVECASAATLADIGPRLLRAGVDLIPLSLTALCDPAVEAAVLGAAADGPGRLEVPPGAVGTLDLLAAAREEGLERVVYRQLKSPAMWARTPAADLCDLAAVRGRTVILSGSVREVAARFPRNLNVSVGVALAGLGLDRTAVEVVADPALSETAHELDLDAGPGSARLRLSGRPVGPDGDPVDYTTFGVLRLLLRRRARVMV